VRTSRTPSTILLRGERGRPAPSKFLVLQGGASEDDPHPPPSFSPLFFSLFSPLSSLSLSRLAATLMSEPTPSKRIQRKARRAGRKEQLRRILRSYFEPAAPVDPSYFGSEWEEPTHVDETLAWRLIPITFTPPKPRVVSVEPVNIRIRIKEWRLHPIALEPVVYPATVPKADPRYDTYISKRSSVLYPPDDNNNSAQPNVITLD